MEGEPAGGRDDVSPPRDVAPEPAAGESAGERAAPESAARKARRPAARRRLSGRKRLAFALVATAGPLLAAEGVLRLRERWREERKGPALSPRQVDTFRDRVLVPGARLEGPDLLVAINSFGMRAPEPARLKPADLTRIVCIGGSSTYGLFTSQNDATWPARTGAHLRAAGREEVEVLNAGAPAWDLRTSQTNLDLRVYALEPDLIVACHAYNDAVANLDPGYEKDSHAESPWRLWRPLRASALYRFMASRGASPRAQLEDKADALCPEGLEAFERNLRRLVRRSRARGAEVVLCTEPTSYRPTREQSEADGVPDLERWFDDLSPFSWDALLAALAAYNEKIREVARDEGVLLVDLERLLPDDVSLYTSPVHHSDEGEDAVGRLVAEALLASGVLDRAKPE